MSTQNPTRQPVLVLLHPDGFVEVFSDKQLVDCRIICVPQMSTPEGEKLSESYVDSLLTHRYREIYYPGYRVAAENWRRVTPRTIAKRIDEVSMLRSLDEVKHHLANLPTVAESVVTS